MIPLIFYVFFFFSDCVNDEKIFIQNTAINSYNFVFFSLLKTHEMI